MYARRIRGQDQRWSSAFQPSKYLIRPNIVDRDYPRSLRHTIIAERNFSSWSGLISRHILTAFSSQTVSSRSNYAILQGRFGKGLKNSQLRFYSSEGDGRNASEDKHTPVKEGASFDKGKTWWETDGGESSRNCNPHAQLGEEDQKGWLNNEKLFIERKKKESPFLTRREKFKNEFLCRVVPWEKIDVSWESFPYYINEHAKSLLVECTASHLKHKKFTSSYGARLASSSGRILLQSCLGSELYQERLVRALARDLQVPLLVLDSNVLAPYGFGVDCLDEGESDDENAESGEECASESEVDEENDASNEEERTSSFEGRTDCSDDDGVDVEATAEAALKKLVLPFKSKDFEKIVLGEPENSESTKSETVESSNSSERPLKKGDWVKYIGPSLCLEADNGCLSSGQRGEVYDVNEDRVAVIVDIDDVSKANEEGDEKTKKQVAQALVYWIDVMDLVRDLETQAEDFYFAMEAFSEVVDTMQPLIVYFPDCSQWLSRAVRRVSVHKVQEIFDRFLSGPVVSICGQNKIDTGSKQKENLTMVLSNFIHLAKLPPSLKHLFEGFKATERSDDKLIYRLFTNVLRVYPPKEDHLLRTFNKQLEEDRRFVISQSNLNKLRKVLEEHELSCMDLLHVNTDGVILTKRKAEEVVGWAKNHYLSSCLLPFIKWGRLHLPRESINVAILRLKEQETVSQKSSRSLKNLAKDDYERNFLSAVVPPGETGVRFADVGALEDVKKALNELVILPMKRPELFSRGNLLRPSKGVLLFGPPGTGKTLLGKALAAEAGANFISITASTLTSKWFGDAEKLTKALFSFASKLAPAIIFVDEVDSLLGARGGASEHEATRRMRNEFMAAWDGLRSKDSERILILGATNRPFDLDDAVIRRLPRRIYVDLPDAENRMKILKILLAQENLDTEFQYEKLANATEGYSGSDLKNLCIAAAYRPVQELLEEEDKGRSQNVSQAIRGLKLDDFIQSKAKVGPSVSYDVTSVNELRKWNERYGEGGSRKTAPFGF